MRNTRIVNLRAILILTTLVYAQAAYAGSDASFLSSLFSSFSSSFNSFTSNNSNNSKDSCGQTQCYSETFSQSKGPVTTSLDILFVVNNEDGMSAKRQRVADSLLSLLDSLPSTVDYQIAVIMGQGYQGKWRGRLFSNNNAPIFSSKKMTSNSIHSEFKLLMQHLDVEGYTGEGKEGLYSLKEALTTEWDRNRAKGFFRTGAALLVVFVSDAHDICSDSKELGWDLDLSRDEKSSRDRQCRDGISSSAILSLIESRHKNFLVAGIGHGEKDSALDDDGCECKRYERDRDHDHDHDDRGFRDRDRGWLSESRTCEREGRHGGWKFRGLRSAYMHILRMGNGVPIEIDENSYDEGLAKIGKIILGKMQVNLAYALSHPNVDTQSIKVSVGGKHVDCKFDSHMNGVHLAEGCRSHQEPKKVEEVKIEYCAAPVVRNPASVPSPSSEDPTPEVTTPVSTPTATSTPDSTSTPTPVSTPTATTTPAAPVTPSTPSIPVVTPTATSTPDSTPVPTSTPTSSVPTSGPTPASVPTPTSTPTTPVVATPTSTPVAIPTATSTPEAPVIVPTSTATPVTPAVVPTATSTPAAPVVVPTATSTPETPVVVPTSTPVTVPTTPAVVPTATSTPEIPVVVPTSTSTPVTPVVVPTTVSTPVFTPTPPAEVPAPVPTATTTSTPVIPTTSTPTAGPTCSGVECGVLGI